MKKTFSVLTAIALVAGSLLTGCGQNADNSANTGQSGGKKIGMVADLGGVNDNSYNQSGWEGLQKLGKDKGVQVKYLESKSDADYETNLNQFVQQNWDLKWAIGFSMDNAVKRVAAANKDTYFGIVDSDLGGEIPANVASVTFKEEQGSFLVGLIAGYMTKTNKVGFVGGVDFATINKFEYGFKAGVKAANPNAEVFSVYTGSFSAPDLGKQAAATMYDKGADIIYHASGATGDGVFNEAKERKANGKEVWVIGVDKDQSVTFGTDVTLTSMIKRVDQAIYQMSEQFLNGNFPVGKQTVLGLAEEGVGIAPTTNVNVPADILEKVNTFREKIIKGELKVPATKDEFNNF
ncbi:BMP family lipoprotein [Brevibacillus sp. H7]|uniref:BMP family lipoprotein n=1 Tax=Brevibacillus sp. H7 TaxID=3349138 RepID=UPI0037F64F6C